MHTQDQQFDRRIEVKHGRRLARQFVRWQPSVGPLTSRGVLHPVTAISSATTTTFTTRGRSYGSRA